VTFRLDARAFSYWDSRRERWRVAPGCYRVEIGSSAQAIVDRELLALRGGRCP
jgi:beta-glucosidase